MQHHSLILYISTLQFYRAFLNSIHYHTRFALSRLLMLENILLTRSSHDDRRTNMLLFAHQS
jgi:hypothetical protein